MVSVLGDRDLHTVMLTEMRALSAEHHAAVVKLRDDYESLLRGQIAADQKAGRLRTDVDAKLLTLALLNGDGLYRGRRRRRKGRHEAAPFARMNALVTCPRVS